MRRVASEVARAVLRIRVRRVVFDMCVSLIGGAIHFGGAWCHMNK